MNVLIIEDGFEYIELMQRFLGDRYHFTRASDFESARQHLASQSVDLVYLDLNFERLEDAQLLGDWDQLRVRFNGDAVKSRQYIARNQGLFILAALRREGVSLPVIISHDFSREKDRWSLIEKQHKPVYYVSDNAGPTEVSALFERWGASRGN